MKAIKKTMAIIMCLCMIIGCFSLTAFAADATCSITIKNPTNSEATVVGKTFNIYKVFDAKTIGSVTSYSWALDDDGNAIFYDFFFNKTNGVIKDKEATVVNAVDYISTFDDNDGINFRLAQLAEALYTYVAAKDNIDPITVSTDNTSATQVKAEGLACGYYLVYDATDLSGDTSAVRSAVMLSNATSDVTITLKANRPQIEKYVLENDNVTYGKATSANIGDVVTFKIDLVVPSHNHYQNYEYYVEDTMPESMTFVADSIKVYKNGTEVAENTYYDIEASTNGADFKVNFTDYIEDATKYPIGTKISIEYQAEITNKIIPGAANNNTATLYYSNDPAKNTVGSTSSTASIYTFVLTKYSEDAHGNFSTATRLANAKFQIYEIKDNVRSDEPIKFTKKTANAGTADAYDVYVVDPNGTVDTVVSWDGKAPAENETITNANHFGGLLGDVTIFGLGEGEYEIVETEAPAGYYAADAAIEFNIVDTTDDTGAVSNLTVTGSYAGKVGSIGNANGSKANLLTWIDFADQPGEALPETGGMGTTIFTVLGIILMAGAAAFFTSRKRSSAV